VSYRAFDFAKLRYLTVLVTSRVISCGLVVLLHVLYVQYSISIVKIFMHLKSTLLHPPNEIEKNSESYSSPAIISPESIKALAIFNPCSFYLPPKSSRKDQRILRNEQRTSALKKQREVLLPRFSVRGRTYCLKP
jgi:hypothetical protein